MSDESMEIKRRKIDMSLLPLGALQDAVSAYQVGVDKHGRDSWRNGMPYSVCHAAMLRHLTAWQDGEDFDPVDGQSHMSAITFYALAILQYERDGLTHFDDRFGHDSDPEFQLAA